MSNLLRQEGIVASQPYIFGRSSRKTVRFLQLLLMTKEAYTRIFEIYICVRHNHRFFKMLNALVENLNANNSEMSRSYRGYWRYERQKQGMKLRTLRNPEHEYISNLGISTGIAETWIAISYWLCLFKHVKMNFGYILAKFDIFFPKILFPI